VYTICNLRIRGFLFLPWPHLVIHIMHLVPLLPPPHPPPAAAFSSMQLGLAQAIVEIINARAKQDNFQLICITHDEEFVDILGKAQLQQSSKSEYYWRISREEGEFNPNVFYTKIERQEWDA
jgi:hypothetical protein